MSYPYTPINGNSCFFKVGERQFALSLLHYTDMGEEWHVRLHEKIDGQWRQLNPLIAQYFNNFDTEWAKFKNTSEFIKSHFPKAEQALADALATLKPGSKENHAECTAYDFAMDVEYKDGHFGFNKPLPLSHNLLP